MEEPRHVKLQKGSEPLGISIVSGEKGGVYVSKVTGGSIAHQAGLEYGDQLLEVSGSLPAWRSGAPASPSRHITARSGCSLVQWHKPAERHGAAGPAHHRAAV